MRDFPEWSKEFTENLEDTEVPASGNISHDSDTERPTKVASRKQSVYTHLPNDQHCEVCKAKQDYKGLLAESELAKQYFGAENFGDLITADHKVLSEGCESRNNHRYAVVVQDLATQWIQSYPCKTKKNHRKHREACKSSWSQIGNLKSFTLTIPWNLAKLVKIFPGIIVRRHHTDQKQMGLQKAVRRVKEGTSAVLLESGLDENWWADSMECHTYLGNVQDLLSDGKTLYERRFGKSFNGPIIPFGSLVEYHPVSAKDQSRIHQFGIRFVRVRVFTIPLLLQPLSRHRMHDHG